MFFVLKSKRKFREKKNGFFFWGGESDVRIYAAREEEEGEEFEISIVLNYEKTPCACMLYVYTCEKMTEMVINQSFTELEKQNLEKKIFILLANDQKRKKNIMISHFEKKKQK